MRVRKERRDEHGVSPAHIILLETNCGIRVTREVRDESPSDQGGNNLSHTPESGQQSQKPLMTLRDMLEEHGTVYGKAKCGSYLVQTSCGHDFYEVVRETYFPPTPKPKQAIRPARATKLGAAPAAIPKIPLKPSVRFHDHLLPMISARTPYG